MWLTYPISGLPDEHLPPGNGQNNLKYEDKKLLFDIFKTDIYLHGECVSSVPDCKAIQGNYD